MPWEYVADHTIGTLRLRLAATDTGFVVTRIGPGEDGQSLRITRKRFGHDARHAVGVHCIAEALAAGEYETECLRSEAQRAIRRAFGAQQTLRPGCASIRNLEQDGVTKTQIYLETGQALARACAELEQELDRLGFPTGEREMPEWIRRLFSDHDAQPVLQE